MNIENVADATVSFVRELYGDITVTLHRPVFAGKEKEYLAECIDSNFVSSAGPRIVDFEKGLASYTGSKFAVATVNGTASLHIGLVLAGVGRNDEVLTQALTFVATCNALAYCGARPVFIDVDRDTLGMSPTALRVFLARHAEVRNGTAYNRSTGRRLSACVPMHTFGLPLRVPEIINICSDFGIPVVEDAAESLGSFIGARHTGTFGRLSTLSSVFA